jgi:LuxR family maltose regulon positive regulatory protein
LFLDEGAPMALLIQEILPRLTKPALRLFATTLLHLFSPNDVSNSQDINSSQALVEPLSQQEARVLKLLVAGLSNGEIASELIVSTNTVKTHVKSIYRKLNIRSREEARIVVKELKLT